MRRSVRGIGLSFTIAGFASLSLTGCSSDSNRAPTKHPVIADDAGTGGKSSASAGGKGGGTATDGGSGNSGGGGASSTGGGPASTGGTSGAGGASTPDGGDAGPVCDPKDTGANPPKCGKCRPTTTLDFLNRCTDSDCRPFDNVARLPRYNNGNLPTP